MFAGEKYCTKLYWIKLQNGAKCVLWWWRICMMNVVIVKKYFCIFIIKFFRFSRRYWAVKLFIRWILSADSSCSEYLFSKFNELFTVKLLHKSIHPWNWNHFEFSLWWGFLAAFFIDPIPRFNYVNAQYFMIFTPSTDNRYPKKSNWIHKISIILSRSLHTNFII